MTQPETQAYVAEWRQIEDKFFRTILNSPEWYMLGVRFVRAIADSLHAIPSTAALVERFQRTTAEDVIPLADALDAPQVVMLDYQQALGAAFYLRAQELHEENARSTWGQRVAAARAEGASWALIYNQETQRYGKRFFQRFETHLADGLTLHSSTDLDWEKGLVYTLEPLFVDLATGLPRRDIRPAEAQQEFKTQDEWAQAVVALKQKYP